MVLTRTDLPKSIRIGDKDYLIKTDFRTWIKFESMLQDDEIPDEFKTYLQVRLLGNNDLLNEDMESVQNALFSFYRLDQPIRKATKTSNDKPYSFEVDMPWIYAAFREQYQIDLLTADLHWWEFKAMFDSLSGDTMFGKIMSYRTADLSKMSESMRKELAELKAYWSLDSGYEDQRDPYEIEAELLANVKR